MLSRRSAITVGLVFFAALELSAAPRDRISRSIDARRTRALTGSVSPSAKIGLDQGVADQNMRLDDLVLLLKPSDAQQADLDRLLADQQNPSSPRFHQWLTPEEFGERFGLSAAD